MIVLELSDYAENILRVQSIETGLSVAEQLEAAIESYLMDIDVDAETVDPQLVSVSGIEG